MDRRAFLAGALGIAGAAPALAAKSDPGGPVLRGTLGASELKTASLDDQTFGLQQILDGAAEEDRTVFLPAGRYVVSNLNLPRRVRLSGVPGATVLVYGGGGSMVTATGAEIIAISGITFDGANQSLDEYVPGIVHFSESRGVAIENCRVEGSKGSGIALDRCAGRIDRTIISRVRDAGIRAIESTGLSVADNVVTDCGNGGILVHRWEAGEDGSIVTGNRIERIAAEDGGTGQNGNGINVFRAHGVIIANNRIADCAFTAVRANSADNVQITGNNCLRSGEVGIYSEFSFAAAVISNNIVDGAATGISVVNFNEGGHLAVVSGNIVRNLKGKGPYLPEPPGFGVGIAVEADATVTGNVIEGAPLFGIGLGWGPYLRDVAVTGNVIRRASIGIAVTVVEGAGAAVINDNLISGAEHGAIVGMRWADRASDDLALTGAEAFPHLMVDRNRIS